ncbi:hypothetical protein, partial [Longimicrobium sp.]|uniref:hypothetical protein n=1 Tax=Longimicrobium sp. TaxID=2029185 RepID=UPI002C6CD265
GEASSRAEPAAEPNSLAQFARLPVVVAATLVAGDRLHAELSIQAGHAKPVQRKHLQAEGSITSQHVSRDEAPEIRPRLGMIVSA